VLSPGGVAITTWFLFDKREFPMMQWFQNMLFVNEFDQTNAALFARAWLVDLPRHLGLRMTRIVPPAIRGFQWAIEIRMPTGGPHVDFPEDRPPYGLARPAAGTLYRVKLGPRP